MLGRDSRLRSLSIQFRRLEDEASPHVRSVLQHAESIAKFFFLSRLFNQPSKMVPPDSTFKTHQHWLNFIAFFSFDIFSIALGGIQNAVYAKNETQRMNKVFEKSKTSWVVYTLYHIILFIHRVFIEKSRTLSGSLILVEITHK